MIGIVTLYDSPNCGSRLQAYALSLVVKNMGKDVVFLRTGARKPFFNKGKTACKYCFQGKFKKAFFYFKHIAAYMQSYFKFNVVDKESFNCVDKIILGSDEIWNVARTDIARFPVFWGQSLTPFKISYAPSVHQSNECDFERLGCFAEMSAIKAISVRDEHSREVVSKFLNRDVAVVCDPTMLISKDKWISLEKECHESAEFILLYCFAYQITCDDEKKIKAFAEEKNMKLISVADYLPFADENLPLNSEEFIGYIHKASYVIASTFHGTCFSLIFQKKFAVISRNSPKVENLLSLFESSELNCVNRNSVSNIIDDDKKNDHRLILLNEIRKKSLDWLKQYI